MEKLLRSLTLEIGYVVATIEESKNLEKISIEELLGSLQVHEQHMQKKTNFIVRIRVNVDLSDRGLHSRGCGHGRGRERGRGEHRSVRFDFC